MRANIFRPHYPQTYDHYISRRLPLPGKYCPGTGTTPKGKP